MRFILTVLAFCIPLTVHAISGTSPSTHAQNDTKSLVNAEIERLEIPPTPYNMKLPVFGQSLIGWGTGPEGAKRRLEQIRTEDVAQMKEQGLSLEMVSAWQRFYENETQRNAGNPTAPLRAQLMNNIRALW